MSTVYLIRHGMTEANEKHLYCGSTDLPLSEAGIAALRDLHYNIKNAVFLTSGMKRTEQTLELLFGSVPHRPEPRFREMDFGCFEMRGYEALKNDPSYQEWITGDNERNTAPDGESGKQMQERALAAFFELYPPAQDTVIVTHGGIISAIMAQLFQQETKNRYQWQPKPGHGYAITQGRYFSIPAKA